MDLTNYNTMSSEEIKKLRNEFISEILNFASDNQYVTDKLLWYYTKIPELKGLKLSNKDFNYEEFKLIYTKETILKKYKDYQILIKNIKKHHIDLDLLEKIIQIEGPNFGSLNTLLENKNITVKDLRNNYLSDYPISLFNVDFGVKRELINYRADFKKREKAYTNFVAGDKKKFNALMEKLNNYAGTCLISVLDKLNYDGLMYLTNVYNEKELIYIAFILKEDKISLEEILVNAQLHKRMTIMYANNSEDYNTKFAYKFKEYLKTEKKFEKDLYIICNSEDFYNICIDKLAYDGGSRIFYEGLEKGFDMEDIFNLFFGKMSLSFNCIRIIYHLIDLGYYTVDDIKANLQLEKPLKIPLQKNIDECTDLDKVLLLKRIDEYHEKLNKKLGVNVGGRR